MARFSLSPPKAAASPTNSNNSGVVKSPEFKWTFPPPQDQYSTSQNEQLYYKYLDNNYNYRYDDDDSSDSDDESLTSENSETPYNNHAATQNQNSEVDSEEEEEPPHPLGFVQNSHKRYGKTRFGPTVYDAIPPRTDIFNVEDEMAWNTLLRVGLRTSGDGDGGGKGGGGSESNSSYYERQQTQSFPPINTGGYHLKNNCGVSTDRLIRGASKKLTSASASLAQDEMRELLLGMDRIANLVRAANYVGDDKDQHQQHATSSSTSSSISTSPYAQPRSTSKLLQLAKACEQYQTTTLSSQMSQISTQRTRQYQQSHATIQQLIQADISLANNAQERISSRQAIHDKLEKETRDKLERERREVERLHQLELQKKHDEEEHQRAVSEEKRQREMKRQEQVRHAEEEAEREVQTKYAFVTRAQSLISNLDSLRSGGSSGGDNTTNTSLLSQFDKDKSVSKRRLQFKKVVNGKINTLSHECTKILDVGRIVSEAIVGAERDDAAAATASGGGGGGGVMTMGKKYLLDLLASNLIVRVQAGTFNGVRGDGFPLAGMIAYVSTQCEEIGPLLEAHLYSVCPTAIPTMSLESPADGGGDEHEMMESLGMIRDKDGVFESFDKFLNRTEGLISIMADIMSSTPSDHKLLGGHEGAMIWLERFLDLLPEAPTKPLPLLTAPVLVAFLTGAGHMLANKFPTKMKPAFDTIQNDILNRLDESDVGVPSATRLRKVMDAGFDKLRSDLPPGAVAALYDGKPGTGTASASASCGGVTAATSFQNTTQTTAAPNQQQQQQGFGDTSSGNPFSSSSNWGNVAPAPTQSGFAPAAPATNPSPFASTSQQPQATGFAAATPATNPSPFASASQQPQSSGFGQPQSSGFGSSPFGVTPATSTSNQSPFATQPPSTGFANPGFNSSSAAPPVNSPFGTTQSSPFGNNMSNAPSPSPFGTNPSSSGFGNTKDNRPPCKFFKEGKCKNGANCRFSHETTSGNGGGGGFGGFGNQTNATQTPFSSQSSGFGGNSNTNNNRPPCKFFAEGKCRNGANCKFSHDSGGGAGGFGNQNSTFGAGGFGSAPAPSPFGGGGAAPAPSPFGGGGGFASAPAPSPFGGGGSAPAPSPFGGGGATFGGGGAAAPTPSPFGGSGATFGSGLAPAPSPFGGGGAAPAPSPFGGGFGGGAPAPSPFGSAMPNSNTPFGGPTR